MTAITIANLRISPNEQFVDVEGYEGHYLVSNMGRVISLRKKGGLRKEPIVLKSWISGHNRKGYDMIELNKDGSGKKAFIHRLVAKAFIPNPNNLPEVNHKDRNKRNNCSDNLEWCDRLYNVAWSKDDMKDRSKAVKVTSLKNGNTAYFKNELILNKLCGFTQRIVRECCNGLRDNAYGCTFQFMEG